MSHSTIEAEYGVKKITIRCAEHPADKLIIDQIDDDGVAFVMFDAKSGTKIVVVATREDVVSMAQMLTEVYVTSD